MIFFILNLGIFLEATNPDYSKNKKKAILCSLVTVGVIVFLIIRNNNQVLSDASSNDFNSGKFPLETQGEVNDQNSLLRKDNNQVLSDASSNDFNSGKFPLETQVEVSDQNSLLSSPLEILLNLFGKEPRDIEMFAKENFKSSQKLEEVLFKKQYLRYSSGLLFTFDNSDNVDVYYDDPNRQNCFELTNLSKTDFLQAIRLKYPKYLQRVSNFVTNFTIRVYRPLNNTLLKEVVLEPTKMNFVFIKEHSRQVKGDNYADDGIGFSTINQTLSKIYSFTDFMLEDSKTYMPFFYSSVSVFTHQNKSKAAMEKIINLIVKEVDKEKDKIDSDYDCFENAVFYRVPIFVLFSIKDNLKTCLSGEINIIDISNDNSGKFSLKTQGEGK